MTDAELAEIEARVEGAEPTQLRWHVSETEVYPEEARGWVVVRCVNAVVAEIPFDRMRAREAVDRGEFIAHARTDVPALVAEVRRLRALVATGADALEHTIETAEHGWIHASTDKRETFKAFDWIEKSKDALKTLKGDA